MSENIVLCFDRDLTVDINCPSNAAGASILDPDMNLSGFIPDDAEGVPLAWVQHWAHETDYHVWATGNQHLRTEAKIPGLKDAEDLWETYWTGEYEYDEPVSFYGKPQRRDGLRLIKDLYDGIYPNQDFRFVVVDDVDLSELVDEGWMHYFPWDFREYVEADKVSIREPPTETPAPGVPLQSDDHDYDYVSIESQVAELVRAAKQQAATR